MKKKLTLAPDKKKVHRVLPRSLTGGVAVGREVPLAERPAVLLREVVEDLLEGGRVHVAVFGAGAAVMIVPELVEAGEEVGRVDRRGQGRRESGEEGGREEEPPRRHSRHHGLFSAGSLGTLCPQSGSCVRKKRGDRSSEALS